jgi:hypothetical protein
MILDSEVRALLEAARLRLEYGTPEDRDRVPDAFGEVLAADATLATLEWAWTTSARTRPCTGHHHACRARSRCLPRPTCPRTSGTPTSRASRQTPAPPARTADRRRLDAVERFERRQIIHRAMPWRFPDPTAELDPTGEE